VITSTEITSTEITGTEIASTRVVRAKTVSTKRAGTKTMSNGLLNALVINIESVSAFFSAAKRAAFLIAGVLVINLTLGCATKTSAEYSQDTFVQIRVGAEQPEHYLSLLKDKRVGLVVNQSAQVRLTAFENRQRFTSANEQKASIHLLDALLERQVNVQAVFSPEHGFRGNKGAGEKVSSGIDTKTGLPIHSLYGSTKKPTAAMLANIDVLVFDIQDVGVRFYTYLSTLHYVIEAAFEHNIDVVVLDRPNPNGQYVSGPILESAFSSFIGMHPIPVLHGMTLGELAKMMIGESWVDTPSSSTSSLKVIPISNYQRTMPYSLPVAPSPNLPNDLAVALYPTLCFFEGTDVSVGRGTHSPFQLIGHPEVQLGAAEITVKANTAAPKPKHENKTLFASLFKTPIAAPFTSEVGNGIDVQLLINTYQAFQRMGNEELPPIFFTRPDFFDKLAGTNTFREMIKKGKSAQAIKKSWMPALREFKAKRRPYLLYPDT